jgi:hypothetical protein
VTVFFPDSRTLTLYTILRVTNVTNWCKFRYLVVIAVGEERESGIEVRYLRNATPILARLGDDAWNRLERLRTAPMALQALISHNPDAYQARSRSFSLAQTIDLRSRSSSQERLPNTPLPAARKHNLRSQKARDEAPLQNSDSSSDSSSDSDKRDSNAAPASTPCPRCGKTFRGVRGVKAHQSSCKVLKQKPAAISRPKTPSVQCGKCNKTYASAANLGRHRCQGAQTPKTAIVLAQSSPTADLKSQLIVEFAKSMPKPVGLADIRSVVKSELRERSGHEWHERRGRDADTDVEVKRRKTEHDNFMNGQEFLKKAMLETMEMTGKVATVTAAPRAYLDQANSSSSTSPSEIVAARLKQLEGLKPFLTPAEYAADRKRIIEEARGQI